MKILHVIASVDRRGGGPIQGVFSSSRIWAEHGYERHIASLDAPEDPCVAQSPVQTYALGIAGKLHSLLRQKVRFFRFGYTPHLAPWVLKNAKNYDAVIINGLWNYSAWGAWRGLRYTNTPYFVFPHGMLDPWFNAYYPIKTIFKTIYWKLFEHKVLRDAAGVLYTCEEEMLLARDSFSPYRAREYVVGYGAKDITGDPETQLAAFYEHAPFFKERKLILFLSRIHEKKGADLLIDAFGKIANDYPRFDVLIAGPGAPELIGSLQARAQALGVGNRIHWPGMLMGDVKFGAIRAAEFFVLPSHQENFGIAIVEAMALSKPVLITNKVNIWREIKTDGAGIVVNDDVQEITNGLRLLCSMSNEERSAMGAAGRRSFLNRFDLEKNALDLVQVIENLSGRNKVAREKAEGGADAH